MDELSLVLVTINQNEANAYVQPISNAEACDARPSGLLLRLSNAEISLPINDRREIRLTFKAGASPCHKTLVLQSDGFTPAKGEVHVVPHRAPSVHIDR
jgi:hypothetical protein